MVIHLLLGVERKMNVDGVNITKESLRFGTLISFGILYINRQFDNMVKHDVYDNEQYDNS